MITAQNQGLILGKRFDRPDIIVLDRVHEGADWLIGRNTMFTIEQRVAEHERQTSIPGWDTPSMPVYEKVWFIAVEIPK